MGKQYIKGIGAGIGGYPWSIVELAKPHLADEHYMRLKTAIQRVEDSRLELDATGRDRADEIMWISPEGAYPVEPLPFLTRFAYELTTRKDPDFHHPDYDKTRSASEKVRSTLLSCHNGIGMARWLAGMRVTEEKNPPQWAVQLAGFLKIVDEIRREIKVAKKKKKLE